MTSAALASEIFIRFAEATFDIDRYVERLDGSRKASTSRQRAQRFITLRDEPLFDEHVPAPGSTVATRKRPSATLPAGRWHQPQAGENYYSGVLRGLPSANLRTECRPLRHRDRESAGPLHPKRKPGAVVARGDYATTAARAADAA